MRTFPRNQNDSKSFLMSNFQSRGEAVLSPSKSCKILFFLFLFDAFCFGTSCSSYWNQYFFSFFPPPPLLSKNNTANQPTCLPAADTRLEKHQLDQLKFGKVIKIRKEGVSSQSRLTALSSSWEWCLASGKAGANESPSNCLKGH